MRLLATLAVVGGVVAIVLILAIIYLQRKQAEAQLTTMESLGFHLHPTLHKDFIEALQANSYLFDRGHSRKFGRAYHSEYGGRSVWAIQYRYTYGRLHFSLYYLQLVMAFPLFESDLPIFSMRPASVVEEVASALGYPHIKFDANLKFSRSYIVHSPEEGATRAMLSPPVLSHFEGLPKAKWSFEYNGQCLVVYQHGVTPEPKELPQFVAEAFSLAELLFAGRK